MFSSVSVFNSFKYNFYSQLLFFRANDVPNSEGGFPIENILTQIREMRKKKLNY